MNTYIAKTFHGLEDVLAQELRDLGAKQIEVIRRGAMFKGDDALLYRVNMGLHTGITVLKHLFEFEAKNEKELYNGIAGYDWSNWLQPEGKLKIDSILNSTAHKHSRFVSQLCKDAIVDQFREKFGKRPSVSLKEPDLTVHVNINDTTVRVSLNTSGEPLFKRKYRVNTGEAPINEVLAAGILKLMKWDGSIPLYDGMCGSGTFLIEGGMIAANMAPNLHRNFAFQEWPSYDRDLHIEEGKKLEAKEKEITTEIYGSDINNTIVGIAEQNAEEAGLADAIQFKRKPFSRLKPNDEQKLEGLMLLNPPYGVRLEQDDMEDFYIDIGNVLKNNFPGFKAAVISSDAEALKFVGLKPNKKYVLFNGGLECKLHEYNMFKGSWAEKKTEEAED